MNLKHAKRWLAAPLAVLTLSAALTGCQNITTQTGAGNVTLELDMNRLPNAEVSDKTVTCYFPGSQATVDKDLNLQATLGVLREKYGVEVEFEFAQAQEYATKLGALVAGGTPPDLVKERDNANLAFIKNKLVQPIDSYFDLDSGLWSEMKDYVQPSSWNGKVLSMPLEFKIDGQFIYSNKKLFDEAGLDYPSIYAERGEWNWDTMLDLAQQLTVMGSSGKPEVYGYADQTAYGILSSAGLDLITQDETGKFVGNLGNATLTAAMNFYYDLGPQRYNVLLLGASDDDLPNGKVAMIRGNHNKLAFLKDMLGYLDVAPIPAYPDSNTKYVSGGVERSYYICNGASNVNGAVAFINCSRLVEDAGNTRENQMAVIKDWNSLPAGEDTEELVGRMVDMYEKGYTAIEPRATETLYSDMGTFWSWTKKLTQPWSTVESSWKNVFQSKVDELNQICADLDS